MPDDERTVRLQRLARHADRLFQVWQWPGPRTEAFNRHLTRLFLLVRSLPEEDFGEGYFGEPPEDDDA
jgi:hypothetical protein